MKEKLTGRFGKKIILSAIIALGFGIGTSQAQVSLRAGVVGGPQFTTFSSNWGKYNGLVGFNGGVAGELRVGKYLGFEWNGLFSIQGAKRSYTDSTNYGVEVVKTTWNSEDRLSYLQNHLLVKFNIPLGSKPILPYDITNNPGSGLTFYAGAYNGLLMGYSRGGTVKTEYNVGGDAVTVSNKPDPDKVKANGILPTDFGFTAGAGAYFGLTDRMLLNIDIRFSRSLTSFDGPVKSQPDAKSPTEFAPTPAIDEKVRDGYYGHYEAKFVEFDPYKSTYVYVPADIFHQTIGLQIGLKWVLL